MALLIIMPQADWMCAQDQLIIQTHVCFLRCIWRMYQCAYVQHGKSKAVEGDKTVII